MPIAAMAKLKDIPQSFLPSEELTKSAPYRALSRYVRDHDDSRALQDQFCQSVEAAFAQSADPSNNDDEEVSGALWQAWGAVTGIAAEIESEHDLDRLVAFVLGIQDRQNLSKEGQSCKVWDAQVWSDLPIFGAQAREVYNLDPSQADNSRVKQQWININTFLAKLTQEASKRGSRRGDFSLYAIWALRAAYEEESQPSEAELRAAQAWQKHAFQSISQLVSSDKSFEGRVAAPGPRYKDKNWTGFSSERGEVWEKRAAELSDLQ